MSSKLSQPWIPIEKIEDFVQLEPAIITLSLALGAWLTYRVFLRRISPERQRTLRNLFRNLTYHLLLGISLFAIYYILQQIPNESNLLQRVITYVGLATIFMGAVIFVKVWRILVFEYFLLSHMKVAFPVLLVNLFTLILSLILAAWIGAELFNIRLTPLLATSAIFSLVLGLAMQDTLGNLFAGIALQFDKPYEIGDWIEIQSHGDKWSGQVYEITWRATILIAFTEELITVPNRVVAQAQISNYSTQYRPVIRSQLFRLPFGTDIDRAKKILISTLTHIPEIRTFPAPKVYLSETTESWIGFKLIYFIDQFGKQYAIADRVYSHCLKALEKEGYNLAGHRLLVESESIPTS